MGAKLNGNVVRSTSANLTDIVIARTIQTVKVDIESKTALSATLIVYKNGKMPFKK